MKFGQAKVPELNIPLGIIEDIVWLQVSVDDALRVDVSQPGQGLPYHLPLLPKLIIYTNVYNAGVIIFTMTSAMCLHCAQVRVMRLVQAHMYVVSATIKYEDTTITQTNCHTDIMSQTAKAE